MKVSRSLDPVFRADLCIGEIEILCLSRCRNSGGGGGRTGGVRENIELRAHNLLAFHSGSENAKYTNTSRRNQVSMASFLCANIHQGDELFDVYCRGKQCALINISALLTARNIPLSACSFRICLIYTRSQNVLYGLFVCYVPSQPRR